MSHAPPYRHPAGAPLRARPPPQARADYCSRREQEDHRVVHSLADRETVAHGRAGAHADSIHARILTLDARRRTEGTPARFSLTTDLNAHGVRTIELVEGYVPVVGASQFIYMLVTVGEKRLERVRADDGTGWTAVLPASHARGGFVSAGEASARRYLYHFSPHVDHLSNRWSVLLQTWNPATGAYEDYPLPDDTAHASNPALTFEVIAFHA